MVELGISLNCPQPRIIPLRSLAGNLLKSRVLAMENARPNFTPMPPRNRVKKIKKMQKSIDSLALECYLSLAMNEPTETTEFVNYCNQTVELIDIENTMYGNLALIRFEDGREDQVPLNTINFLD